MIIINADDWGRSARDTDATATLVKDGRVTSVSAMLFMQDSERAAALAKELGVDVGLHLNFCERFNGGNVPGPLADRHEAIGAFLNRSRYAQLVYNPGLRRAFAALYRAQIEEFNRLYGKMPRHFDGHRHMHLCANMLVNPVIPRGLGVRRGFTFASGEKGVINRAYRRLVDFRLARRYMVTDYFFCLEQCLNGRGRPFTEVADLAMRANVEVMTHPRNPVEFNYLGGPQYLDTLRTVTKGTYAELSAGT